MSRFCRLPVRAVLVLTLALARAAAAQPAPVAELFPQPMRVEHQLIEREEGGDVFYGEPVRDTYGGSWIVSERSDGSRLVIDLARREMTEIRPAEGIYWTIGFGRFAELRGRIAQLEPGAAAAGVETKATAPGRAPMPAPLEVVELAGVGAKSAAVAAARGGALPPALAAPEIRRLAVRSSREAADELAEVWVDPRLRIGAAAQAALGAFEAEALGAPERAEEPGPARLMAAVRQQTGGALPVLTRRVLRRPDGAKVGESEDRVLSASQLEIFPSELVRVPEGLARISHPLESMLAALEAQARIEAALAGREAPR